jgi:hypothetical protein
MGSSFAPNHIGMPLVSPKLKLDFLRRQGVMSRNITGGPPMSIFMGGLNYQIEHHLFPSIARPHRRKIQPLVAAYCAAEGVPYTQTSIWTAYRTVIGYLNSVGLKGKDPFEVGRDRKQLKVGRDGLDRQRCPHRGQLLATSRMSTTAKTPTAVGPSARSSAANASIALP